MFNDLEVHESECIYRDICCPYCRPFPCIVYKEFTNHINTKHGAKNIIRQDFLTFKKELEKKD
jgi:hypothetical protein